MEKSGYAEVMVFDINGKVVKDYSGSEFAQGVNQVVFDASMLREGIYFARIRTENSNHIVKMILQ
jgi:hypothetical protein